MNFNHFEGYDEIPKIAELRNSVVDTKDDLTQRILEDFKYIRTLASDKVGGDAAPDEEEFGSNEDNRCAGIVRLT